MTSLTLTSIRTTGKKVEIVNQLLLPHTVEFVEIDSIEKAHDAIKRMMVRMLLLPRFGGLHFEADSRRARHRVSCRAYDIRALVAGP